MSLSYKGLRGKSDQELIELHDKNVGQRVNNTTRETPEMIRSELFRREIRRSNFIMSILTGIMLFLTLFIAILTLNMLFQM
jgi:hypothetical protein